MTQEGLSQLSSSEADSEIRNRELRSQYLEILCGIQIQGREIVDIWLPLRVSVTLRAARTSGRQCVDTASGLSPRRVKEGAFHQKHLFGELKSSHMDRASLHRMWLTASKSS